MSIVAVQSVDLVPLLPLLVVAGGLVVVLLIDLFAGAGRASGVALGALASCVAAFAATVAFAVFAGGPARETFCVPSGRLPAAVGAPAVPATCAYSLDRFALFLDAVALAAAAVVVLLALADRQRDGEFYVLLLASVAGVLVLASARDLITLFVGLELLSVPAILLAAFGTPGRGIAGAFTFFLPSVVASTLTLLGMALVYGSTGTLLLARVAAGLRHPAAGGRVAAAAVVLTLIGFLFKVAAVPLHSWAPDTYAAAPLPVAAFLSVVSKTGGFVGLLVLVRVGFPGSAQVWGPLLAVVAAATMTVGNVAALAQRDLVRLLAWSSIAQAGYLLAPLAIASERAGGGRLAGAQSALLAYLAIYAVMNLGAFGAVLAHARSRGSTRLEDLPGLGRRAPILAALLVFFLLCLAGAPPGFAGLFAKVAVFRAVLDGRLAWLAVLMAANTAIGFAYYIRVAALAVLAEPSAADAPATRAAAPRVGVAAGAALTLCALLAVVVGFLPQLLLHLTPLAIFAASR